MAIRVRPHLRKKNHKNGYWKKPKGKNLKSGYVENAKNNEVKNVYRNNLFLGLGPGLDRKWKMWIFFF